MAARFYIEDVKETLCERPFFNFHFNAIGNLLYTLFIAWKFLSLIILLFVVKISYLETMIVKDFFILLWHCLHITLD